MKGIKSIIFSFTLALCLAVSVLAICPPDVVSDVTRNGIYFVGGDSKIIGLEKYFKTKLGIKVNSVDQADDLDVMGAAELLENSALLKRILVNI